MRLRSSIALGVTSLFFLVGCTDIKSGSPSPVVQAPESSASDPSSGTGSTIGVFGETKACEVLDQALAGQGYKAGKVSGAGSYNGCETSKVEISLALDLDDRQGIDDLRAPDSKKFSATVNGRRAVQVKDGVNTGSTCQVATEVAPKARAMVTVSSGGARTVDEACQIAADVSVAIEPKLPKA